MENSQYVRSIHIEKNICPVYEKLQKEDNPIFIWGVGALANHVYDYCRKYDIKVCGCFINTTVNTDCFQGLPVFGMDKLLEAYSNFSVIIGHSDYESGLKDLQGIDNIKNIYFISALCYGINHLITEDYLNKERVTVNDMFSNLEDDFSKGCLKAYFEARTNDNARYMFPYYKKGTTYYSNDVFLLGRDELLLDIGACIGNTIWSFVERVQGKYKGIIAVEPDMDNYIKLRENIQNGGLDKVILRRECIYNQNGYVDFRGEAEYGGIGKGDGINKRYPSITVDSLCKELAVEHEISIIKINFPYAVVEILSGACSVLQEKKPKLVIRVVLDEKVLLDVYRTIRKMNPQYKIYFRYTIGMPQGLTLFAV